MRWLPLLAIFLLIAAPAFAAAPALRNFGGIAADASAHVDLTVTLPTHAINDILLVMCWNRDVDETATIDNVAGWSAFSGSPWDRGTSARYWLFWKRATSASETNPICNFSGTTGDVYGVAASYQGAITSGDPWEVVGTPTSGTVDPAVVTGIIALTDESLIVVPLAGENNNNASITTTGTNPATYAENYVETAVGANAMFGFSDGAQTTANATGTVSVDFNVAVPVGWGAVVLALIPPPPSARSRAIVISSVIPKDSICEGF